MIRSALLVSLLSVAPVYADVAVTAPWARASIIAARPAAVYLTLRAESADRLRAVSTPIAQTAMIHEGISGPDGITRMAGVDALVLPAGETRSLRPGDRHIMLTGLTRKLVEGESFPLTLTFENSDEMTVQVPVLSLASKGPEEPAE